MNWQSKISLFPTMPHSLIGLLSFIRSKVLVFHFVNYQDNWELLRYKVTDWDYLKYFKNAFKMNIYED